MEIRPNQELEMPIYLFKEGTNYESDRLIGGRLVNYNDTDGVRFRVWAPNAVSVSVVGDFNDWNERMNPCGNLSGSGIWQTFCPGVKEGDLYKFCIQTKEGRYLYKADPFGLYAEKRPGDASRVYNIEGYEWGDAEWQATKKKRDIINAPVNIYEVHLGSWKRHADGSFYTYAELADELIPYIKEMHYTHVELLPVTEHPLDASWGYQVTSYFAPSSRYGEPKDFMRFIDRCHQAGIGVIMDWVPSHFPKDAFGLYRFDGTPLFEDANPSRGEHKEWGTAVFDYGKKEVQSFLISSAVFWLGKYHVDGLRVDAVASMLYLDYGRKDGEWQPNYKGGRENLEAVAFLRKLNEVVLTKFPGALMVAEESTAWPLVTRPAYDGGLGFNFKWNMGWMNDMLEYVRLDPLFRKGSHNKITFSLMYAFSENFILPISHDEVVHLKKSLLDKMHGNYEAKFAGDRVFRGYMTAHPGKKLLFMGQEFGQFSEWDEKKQLDWEVLKYEKHTALQKYNKTLNEFYLAHPALWKHDNSWDGFEWLIPDDSDHNIVAFLRKDGEGEELLFVCNFAAVSREGYLVGVPKAGRYRELLCSDAAEFGGAGGKRPASVTAKVKSAQKKEYAIQLNIPPLSMLCYAVPADGAADEETEAEAPVSEEKPKRTRKPAAAKAGAASAETPVAEEKPKRTRKPAAAKTDAASAEAPAAEEKPKRPRKPAAAKTEAASAETPVAEEKPKRTRKPAAAKTEAAPAEAPVAEEKPKRTRKPAAAKTEAASAEAPVAEEKPKRTRKPAAAKTEAAPAEAPVAEEKPKRTRKTTKKSEAPSE